MTLEPAVQRAAHAATYGGSGSAVYFGYTANEWAAFGGLLTAVLGLAVTWYFQRKRDKREQVEHDARMGMYSDGH